MTRIAVAAALLALAAPAAADEWGFALGLYGWLAAFDGTVEVGDVSTDVDDITKNTEFTVAAHAEAQRDIFTLIGDVYFVEWDTDAIRSDSTTSSLQTDQWIFELAGAAHLTRQIEVLLAGRLYSIGADVFQDRIRIEERTRNWVDAFVGVRYSDLFRRHWLVSVRGDAGTGGSDLALLGNAFLAYRFDSGFLSGVGYRVLSVDHKRGSGDDLFRWDVVTNGVGVFVGTSY